MKKYIVYYCYLVNKYRKLIDIQFKRLIDSGLYDNVEKIYVNIYGDGELVKKQMEYFQQYDKVVIWSVNTSDQNLYEYQGIKCVYDIAHMIEPNDCILYMHTKGISRNNTLDMEIWRNLMEYHLIDNWKIALELFKVSQPRAVGINLKVKPKLHFSGNFWWGNSAYIKQLEEPKLITSDEYKELGITNRHYFEFWITHFKQHTVPNYMMKNLASYFVGYNTFKEFPFLDKKYFL